MFGYKVVKNAYFLLKNLINYINFYAIFSHARGREVVGLAEDAQLRVPLDGLVRGGLGLLHAAAYQQAKHDDRRQQRRQTLHHRRIPSF